MAEWDWLYRVFALDPNRNYEAERLAEAERQRLALQSRDLRQDIANAYEQSERPTEANVAHGQTGSTPFTVFDYLGLAFILEPPGVLVHAVMTGEKLNWSTAWYAVPFIVLGAISISVGRNWETVKKKLNGHVVVAVDRLSRSYVVPFIIVLCALIGIAILPIWIWPPNRAPSSTSSTILPQPTADEIAAAVVRALPKNASGVVLLVSPKQISLQPLRARNKQSMNYWAKAALCSTWLKTGIPLAGEWREATRQNPELSCVGQNNAIMRQK